MNDYHDDHILLLQCLYVNAGRIPEMKVTVHEH